jgi:hypothetical protein
VPGAAHGLLRAGTAFLALSSLLERRGRSMDGGPRGADARFADGRSLRFVGGLAEGTETVVVYVLFCVFPVHAGPIAWGFTAAVAVTALQRVALGTHLLRHPVDPRPARLAGQPAVAQES